MDGHAPWSGSPAAGWARATGASSWSISWRWGQPTGSGASTPCAPTRRWRATSSRSHLDRVALIGLLERRGTLVGLAEAHLDHPDRPLEAEISVSVLEGWRRAGLGRRLVVEALACAFARGAARATLVFTPDNQPLVRLLRSLGARLEVLRGRATVEQPLPQAA